MLAQFEKLKAVAETGAIVLVKIDGGRVRENIHSTYTVVNSDGLLDRDNGFRQDGADVDVLVQNALDFYASVVEQLQVTGGKAEK